MAGIITEEPDYYNHSFLNRLSSMKEPDCYSNSFFLKTRSDEIFVQFVQPNEYLRNASKLSQKVPLSVFTF